MYGAPSSSFTLATKAVTDLWLKPPSTNSTNAPRHTTQVVLSTFERARVTVHADWVRQYDQGGLVFYANDGSFWVKAGIEFFNGVPNVASVATDVWSDWALVPDLAPHGKATIELAPGEGSLWLYFIKPSGERVPIREITWLSAKPQDAVINVGTYVARPTAKKGDDRALVVHFEDFQLDISSLD